VIASRKLWSAAVQGRSHVLFFGSRYLAAFFALAESLLLAALLRDEFGRAATNVLVGTLGPSLVLGSLTSGMTIILFDRSTEREARPELIAAFLRSALQVHLCISLILNLGLWSTPYRFGGLLFVVFGPAGFIEPLLRVLTDFVLSSLARLLSSASSAAVLVGARIFGTGQLSLNSALSLMVVGSAAGQVIFVFVVFLKSPQLRASFPLVRTRETGEGLIFFRTGRGIYFASALAIIYANIDRFFVDQTANKVDSSSYAMAATICQGLMLLPAAMNSISATRIGEENRIGVKRTTLRRHLAMTSLAVAVCLCVAFVLALVARRLLFPAYSNLPVLTLLLGISVGAFFSAGSVSTLITYSRQAKFLIKSYLSVLVISILVDSFVVSTDSWFGLIPTCSAAISVGVCSIFIRRAFSLAEA
jgi:O-antigen/teichoic acid export membrane protein